MASTVHMRAVISSEQDARRVPEGLHLIRSISYVCLLWLNLRVDHVNFFYNRTERFPPVRRDSNLTRDVEYFYHHNRTIKTVVLAGVRSILHVPLSCLHFPARRQTVQSRLAVSGHLPCRENLTAEMGRFSAIRIQRRVQDANNG